jgi:4-carboxymuconolactone decarboxylase
VNDSKDGAVSIRKNAVLGDEALQQALKSIHPEWGDFCIRAAAEVWGLPLIDQKTKALITIAVDVANTNVSGPGSPFEAHVHMALAQGASIAEVEEILMFMSVYGGFNKAASAFGRLKEIRANGKTAFGDAV